MRSGRGRGRASALGATLVTALLAQGLFYSVHSDRVLSRDDTRNLARAWMVENTAPSSKVVVEPIVPDAWFADPDVHDARTARARGLTRSGRRWIKFPTGRTTIDEQGRTIPGGKGRFVRIEDYERTLRPALVGSYARGGYCWVVTGSTQYGRALADPGEVPNAIAYYRTLARHSDVAQVIDPYRDGQRARPVQLRLELQPLPAGLRATGPHGGDPPSACGPVPGRGRLSFRRMVAGALRRRRVESARRSTD